MTDLHTWARRLTLAVLLTAAAGALSGCRNGAISQHRPPDMKSLWKTAPGHEVLAGARHDAPMTRRGPGR